ncbi:MAG: M48 family metallopeptidase [Acidobacteria bacterium]|nr:M48 family metallopeptidase [Acidobacteriota bacterium]MCL5288966.1 M48 family metallopeptidase [Acidobacteriota bacterium]
MSSRRFGSDAAHSLRGTLHQAVALALVLTLAWAPVAQAERTPFKPGWNLFSPAQDVEIGRKVAEDAERQLPIVNDSRIENYLNSLGRRLAAKAPYEKYPYQFKLVNDRAINAFCLPGGFIYVNRGVIENADNEAQLAGVMAHEISHAALRHGTNQASKAYAAQVPLALLGGMLGSNSVGAVLAQIGAGFATNSILLKYSRDAERQADLLGAQILYDAGYDPRGMPQFFEKLQAQSKGGGMPQWLSSHPNPENRVGGVNGEIEKLGGAPPNYRTDSAEFRSIRRMVMALPAPEKGGAATSSATRSTGRSGRPELPSTRYQSYQNGLLRMSYPDNWKSYGQEGAVTFAPEGGIVDDGRGNAALAYGVIVNVFEVQSDRTGQVTLEDATDQLIDDLRHSNPAVRIARRHERVRIGGLRALSTYLTNDSPTGGKEYLWLVTVLRPEGLVYFVSVAPERDYDNFDQAFQNMLSSVRFPR